MPHGFVINGVKDALAAALGILESEQGRTFQRLRQDVIGAIEREEWAFGIVVRKFARAAR